MVPIRIHSKDLPQDVKDAAFYYIYRMSHPDFSDRIVADPFCGSDPFGKSHYTDQAAQYYTEANPQRGTTDLWPSNDGIFQTFDRARNHLDAGLANVEVGYPQFFWEGASEYADALGRNISKAVSGDLTSQQALMKQRKSGSRLCKSWASTNRKRNTRTLLMVHVNWATRSDHAEDPQCTGRLCR